jgi:hypothetical protein
VDDGSARDIGWAVRELRKGRPVARAGWNGKGMALVLVDGDASKMAYVAMRIVQGFWVPWTCSQTDLLAEDWELAT